MKIAFISYEYPPDTALGGIGTYIYQVSKLMSLRGHHVEIFSATLQNTYTCNNNGIIIHRILCKDRFEFKNIVVKKFEERQTEIGFDFFESPEYGADGYFVKLKFPDLPLLVKLHTPSFLLLELSNIYVNLVDKVRFILGGLLRGKIPKPFWSYSINDDYEYKITNLANRIQSPSISLGEIVSKKWKIRRDKIKIIPYPYTPTSNLLSIQSSIKNKHIVTYIGRLESRKGLLEYVKTIPVLSKKYPELIFRFIGQDTRFKNGTIKKYIFKKLYSINHKLEFNELPYNRIHEIFDTSEIIILPSLWENFPNACLEAMSAGKCILGSENGGMKDMLTQPDCGILINPFNHEDFIKKFTEIYADDERIKELGAQARAKILDIYHEDKIGDLIEEEYKTMVHL